MYACKHGFYPQTSSKLSFFKMSAILFRDQRSRDNILRPGDACILQWTGSPLVQKICFFQCLAPNLSQWWFLYEQTLKNVNQSIMIFFYPETTSSVSFIQEHAFENVADRMSAILFRPRTCSERWEVHWPCRHMTLVSSGSWVVLSPYRAPRYLASPWSENDRPAANHSTKYNDDVIKWKYFPLALCEGNSPLTREFPSQKIGTRSFDVFFDLPPHKRLSKQSRRRWFKTPSGKQHYINI